MAFLRIAGETNPVLLWFWRHGGEDPDWGKLIASKIGQITTALTIYELAGDIVDEEIRQQIQFYATETVNKLAHEAMK